MTLLEDAQHIVNTRGPEGEQRQFAKNGKRIKAEGRERTEFVAYERYLQRLQVIAGLRDPAVEKVVKDMKLQRDFFGGDDADGITVNE